MKKILTCKQQQATDQYTISQEGIASIDLMEKAATLMTEEIVRRWSSEYRIVCFAGAGNNGGDALAIARMLYMRGYEVEVFLFNPYGKISEETATNARRLQEAGCLNYTEVTSSFKTPTLTEQDVVIDGLFGIGLNRNLEGGFAAVVSLINASPAQVVAIDIPSGLMGEDNSTIKRQYVVRANLTLTVHSPKLAFLFSENEEYVGEWVVLDAGISKTFTEETASPYYIIEQEDLVPLIKPRKRFAHKGEFGHSLLIAGSYGMGGCAVLAARAAMRAGTGLVTVHAPQKNVVILQTAVPEAVVSVDIHEALFTYPIETTTYDAVGIGPGLGTDVLTATAIGQVFSQSDMPLVIDADALNICSKHPSLLKKIPQNSILTPHLGEFERLVGDCSNSFERLTKAKFLAAEHSIYIVLKGAWTTIVTPEGDCFFNTSGNPGMAVGGSGDVLTGILTALLAQGYSPLDSCKIGVYLHGLAGDMASYQKGEIGMTAGDIVEAIPQAWQALIPQKRK